MPEIIQRRPGVPLSQAGGLPPVKGSAAVPPASRSTVADPNQRTVNVIIRPNVRDRWSTTLLAYYTPERVEVTARSAMGGNLYAIWQMFDLMEQTWPELSTCLNELKDQAIEEITDNFSLKAPTAAKGKPDPEAERRRDIVEHILHNMAPDIVADENDFEDTLRDMMDDVGKCVSVLEMNFAEDPQPVEIAGKVTTIVPLVSTRWVNPKYYGFPMGDNVDDRLMLNAAELARNNPGRADLPGGQWMNFPQDKFIISIFKQKTGHILSGSLLRQLAGLWAMANFTWEWYLNFVQIFGVPLRIAKVDPNAPDGVKTEIDNLLAEMGSTGYIRLPNGNEIEIKEAMKGGNDSVHKVFLEYLDQICRKRILGQTLTGGEGQHGTQALGTVHENVRSDKIQACAKRKVKTLNTQVIPAICRANFGDTRLMPKFETPEKDNEDPLAKMKRVQIFTAIAPMEEEELYSISGFRVPQAGAKTIGGRSADGSSAQPGEPPLEEEPKETETATARATAAETSDAIAATLHEIIYPAVDRLKKINAAAAAGVDDSTLKLMLDKLLKDFPHICEVAQCDTSLAKQLKPVLQSALTAGLGANKI